MTLRACAALFAILISGAAGAFAKTLPQKPWLEVRFFSAGHGDSALLSTSEGHHLLIDAGRATLGDHFVERRLLPHFAAAGITKLSAFFVSHPHWDHYGDPETLLRRVPAGAVYVNEDGNYSLGDGLRRLGVTPTVLRRGDKLSFGKLEVDVLSPPRDAKPPETVRGTINARNWYRVITAENNRSLVLSVKFGRRRFLFVGDQLEPGEYALLRARGMRKKVRADVLKLGHHGIRGSSAAWLNAVRPRFAVASCGEYDGRMRPPTGAVVARLRARRIRLYRTDRHGDVVFRTDGKTLTVKTHKEFAAQKKK